MRATKWRIAVIIDRSSAITSDKLEQFFES